MSIPAGESEGYLKNSHGLSHVTYYTPNSKRSSCLFKRLFFDVSKVVYQNCWPVDHGTMSLTHQKMTLEAQKPTFELLGNIQEQNFLFSYQKKSLNFFTLFPGSKVYFSAKKLFYDILNHPVALNKKLPRSHHNCF
jgi:hypothetical protein